MSWDDILVGKDKILDKLKVSDYQLKAMRKDGLPVKKIGGISVLVKEETHEFIKKIAATCDDLHDIQKPVK